MDTEKEMEADLHALVETLGVAGKIHVVGHDIGMAQQTYLRRLLPSFHVG